MRLKHATWTLICGLCIAGSAYAVKASIEVKPEFAAESGFDVTAKSGEDGVVTFTVLRDPGKVKENAPESGIVTDQFATLSVFGDMGFVVECVLTPTHANRDGEDRLMYSFKIDRAYVQHSSLTIAEVDDFSDVEGREHLIGGGTFFEFRLSDFLTD